MLTINDKAVAFLGLFQRVSGFRLPSIPLASNGNQAAPHQLHSSVDLECGRSLNIWGQISPTSASGHANLCLQCRTTGPGASLSFAYVEVLSTSISAYGVSESAAKILQASIDGDLDTMASQAETSETCASVCTGDQHCASCKFTENGCKMTAVDYSNSTHSGKPLAAAFKTLFNKGSSKYCGLCPNDKSCSSSRPISVPLRSMDSSNTKCPPGLTACPIDHFTSSFATSTGFECFDIKKDMRSCGGCASLGRGIDCSALNGVASSGCADGKCKIFSCKGDYDYSLADNECIKTPLSST